MRRFLVALALSTIAVTPSFAERVFKETARDTELTAPVGGVVWEKASFDGAPGVTIHGPIQAAWGRAESVDLPEGSNLVIIREKKLKACRQSNSVRLGGFSAGGWLDCAIDKDGDGRFELISFNEVGGAIAVVPPVAYTRGTIPISGGAAQSFKRTITFLGKSGSDIRLSYREFANDLARPAFIEDLTLPAPAQFPQTMLVKDVKLTVLGISGDGLRYRLD